MYTRFLVSLMVLFASMALSGCFIIDEIDSGMDIMDEHSGPPGKKPSAPAPEVAPAAAESQLPAMTERLATWWNDALAEEPVGPDPNDGIVRCTVNGAVLFTRSSSCKIRGGRAGN